MQRAGFMSYEAPQPQESQPVPPTALPDAIAPVSGHRISTKASP